ncbi:MAG: hypothetical protein ACRC9P_00265, partial [Bacteroides sp.]
MSKFKVGDKVVVDLGNIAGGCLLDGSGYPYLTVAEDWLGDLGITRPEDRGNVHATLWLNAKEWEYVQPYENNKEQDCTNKFKVGDIIELKGDCFVGDVTRGTDYEVGVHPYTGGLGFRDNEGDWRDLEFLEDDFKLKEEEQMEQHEWEVGDIAVVIGKECVEHIMEKWAVVEVIGVNDSTLSVQPVNDASYTQFIGKTDLEFIYRKPKEEVPLGYVYHLTPAN